MGRRGEDDSLFEEESGVDHDGVHSLEEGLAELEAELIEKEAVIQTLIETYDTIKDLARMAKQMTRHLETTLSVKQSPSLTVQEIMKTLSEVIEQSRYRLLGRLQEIQIEIIDPQPGEKFNKTFHHVVENESGGKSGTIAQVVRAGYRQRGELLRLADVILYN